MAATYPADGPNGHFYKGTAMLLLGTMAAASALATYEKPGHKRRTDRVDFITWARDYIPWDEVAIEDDQHRAGQDLKCAAAEALYEAFRCTIFHTAGMVHSGDPTVNLSKRVPRSNDIAENEIDVAHFANLPSLQSEMLVDLGHDHVILNINALYWCVRKGIEAHAADPVAVKAILQHHA
jgi:hypothetical protein